MKKIYSTFKLSWGVLTALLLGVCLLTATMAQGQATVTTDRLDYLPGENVVITGTGFTPGETVTIVIEHLNFMFHDDDILYATVLSDSSFVTNEYYIGEFDWGELFYLTATDESGIWAETWFTDGNAADGDGIMTVSPVFVCGGGNNLSFTFPFDGGSSNTWKEWSTITIDVPWVIAPSSNVQILNVNAETVVGAVTQSTSSFGSTGTKLNIPFTNTYTEKQNGDKQYDNGVAFDVRIFGTGVNMPADIVYNIPVQTAQSGGTLTDLKVGNPEIASSSTTDGYLKGSINSCNSTANGSFELFGNTGNIVRWEKSTLVNIVTDTWTAWTPITSAGTSNTYNLNNIGVTTRFRVVLDGSGCSSATESNYGIVAISTNPIVVANDLTDYSTFPLVVDLTDYVKVFSVVPIKSVNYYTSYTDLNNRGTEITDPASHIFAPGTTTVTVVAENVCFTTVHAFDVNSGVAPEITCPASFTTYTSVSSKGDCSGDGTFTLNYATDPSDPNPSAGEFSGVPEPTLEYSTNGGSTYTSFTAGSALTLTLTKGDNVIRLKASNGISPDATCDFTITVEDDEDPALTGDAYSDPTEYNACMVNAEDSVPIWTEANAILGYTDNCPGPLTATLDSTRTSGIDCDWTVTYYYTVFDASLNPLPLQSYLHNGSDQTAPALTGTAYSDATEYNACMVNAEDSVPAWTQARAIEGYTDLCGAGVTATLDSTRTSGIDCDWTVTYYYTVFDECLNPLPVQSYLHNGSDQTAPALTGTAYSDATEYNACMANAEDSVPAWTQARAIEGYTDLCGAGVTATLDSTRTSGIDCDWTVTYYYTVFDECLNPLPVQSYLHNGSDQTAPALTGTAYSDATEYNACMVNAEDSVPAWTQARAIEGYTDLCGAGVTATLDSTRTSGIDCDWTVTYYYTVFDECLNPLPVQSYLHNGSDQTAPALTGTAYVQVGSVDDCMPIQSEAEEAFNSVNALVGYSDFCSGANLTAELTGTLVKGDDCDWTITYTYTVKDVCLNELPGQQYTTAGGDDSAPTFTEPSDVACGGSETFETEPGECTYDAGTGFDITDVVDNCDDDVSITWTLTGVTEDDGITDHIDVVFNPGTTHVMWTVEDECGNSDICSFDVEVKIQTITVAHTSAEAVRIMDEITLYAEVIKMCPNDTLIGEVIFYLNHIAVDTVPAFPIPYNEPGNPDTLRATSIYQIPYDHPTNTGAGFTVRAVFVPDPVASSNYLGSEGTTNLLIYPRDASPFDWDGGFYTGTILAWTTGEHSSTGTITMAAMLKDKNIPIGDLRGARVTFNYVNDDGSLTPIPSAKDLPVGLVNMTDGTVGAASADVQIDIGKSDAESFLIAVEVTGGYKNNPFSGLAQALVTVAKPVLGGSIFGAGDLKNSYSQGQIRGADGLYTDFSFDVQYNKKKTNPQGKMTITVLSWYKPDGTLDGDLHTYLIKSNAINLMVMGPAAYEGDNDEEIDGLVLGANQAIFDAKANLSERLADGTVINVEGNSPLHVTMTDHCVIGKENLDPVPCDSIGITYYNSAGGIWFSSKFNWENVGDEVTTEQILNYGDITVASEENDQSDDSNPKPGKKKSAIIEQIVESSQLKVYPNPFTESLRFEFVLTEDTHVRIDLFDLTGRMVETVFNSPVKNGVKYNPEFIPKAPVSSMYFYRMTIGDAIINGKVVYKE